LRSKRKSLNSAELCLTVIAVKQMQALHQAVK
jgi:hypothetical protein